MLTEILSSISQETEESKIRVLKSDLLLPAIGHLNESTLQKEFRLFKDDPVPKNQRNLTDVRTRMGVLLEYELAKAIINRSESLPGFDFSLQYVISNRFPDLEFRKQDGSFGARFEIKTIEAVAEEASANFDTLIKDIRRDSDYVVVMLWEWFCDESLIYKYPVIRDIYVFNAYYLAVIRDCSWLNKPPAGELNFFQGFDIREAVTFTANGYKKEEGNYGKLMRIYKPELSQYLPQEVKDSETFKQVQSFYKYVSWAGFKSISLQLGLVSQLSAEEDLPFKAIVSMNNKEYLFAGSTKMIQNGQVRVLYESFQEAQGKELIVMNPKFNWKVFDSRFTELASGKKPGELISHLLS